jgi:hypothetical protein
VLALLLAAAAVWVGAPRPETAGLAQTRRPQTAPARLQIQQARGGRVCVMVRTTLLPVLLSGWALCSQRAMVHCTSTPEPQQTRMCCHAWQQCLGLNPAHSCCHVVCPAMPADCARQQHVQLSTSKLQAAAHINSRRTENPAGYCCGCGTPLPRVTGARNIASATGYCCGCAGAEASALWTR